MAAGDPGIGVFAMRIGQGIENSADSDGDGISNLVEEELHLNPSNIDSDGDSIHDGIELLNSTDPTTKTLGIGPDSDFDGFSDELEYSYGTNLANSDTDHDSLSDSYEILLGFNPTNPDSDSDGILDGFELAPYNYQYKNKLLHFSSK